MAQPSLWGSRYRAALRASVRRSAQVIAAGRAMAGNTTPPGQLVNHGEEHEGRGQEPVRQPQVPIRIILRAEAEWIGGGGSVAIGQVEAEAGFREVSPHAGCGEWDASGGVKRRSNTPPQSLPGEPTRRKGGVIELNAAQAGGEIVQGRRRFRLHVIRHPMAPHPQGACRHA
jgi:hypothetical protein